MSKYVGPDRVVRYGSEGERCVVLGGQFICEDDSNDLLLSLLPPIVHISSSSESAASLRVLLELMRREFRTGKPGALIAAAGFASMVLVQILRAHSPSGSPGPGWLGARADWNIGAALGLMHADLARQRRIDDLARAVAMSRTAFSGRFKALVRVPPLMYLTRWHMATASFALQTSDESLPDLLKARDTNPMSYSARRSSERRVSALGSQGLTAFIEPKIPIRLEQDPNTSLSNNYQTF